MKIKPLDVSAYRPRIIANVEGIQKHGKSHFSLTAPKGLLYMNLDKSSKEDILPKFQGQLIQPVDYWPADQTKDEGKLVWDQFQADFKDALKTQEIRTIVIDTNTELRNLVLLAMYGKISQLGNQFMYGGPHQELRNLINLIYPTDKNLILIHKERKEYKNDSWTGEYELSGFGEVPYLVQVNLRLLRERDTDGIYHFKCKILDCSLDPNLIEMELTDELCNFPSLATAIFPNTKPEEWT